jgi:hypothetical protein
LLLLRAKASRVEYFLHLLLLGETIATGDTSICSIWWSLFFRWSKHFSFSEVGQWVTSEQRFSFKTALFGIIERKRETYSERRVYGDNLHRKLLYKVFHVSPGTGCVPVWSGQLSPNFLKQIDGVGRETSEVGFYTQQASCHFTPLPKKRDCGSFQSLALVNVSCSGTM